VINKLAGIIEQVGRDKGIDKQVLISALETALLKAAEKRFGAGKVIEAHYDEEMGEIELFLFKTVVEEVDDEDTEISLEDAHKLDPESVIGDSLGVKLDSAEFGRIDAQTAKQIIIQKVRDAERDIVFNEYSAKKGEIITGIVHRFEKGDIIVDLGRAEAIMPRKEQVKREGYRQGERIRGVVIDVTKDSKGPQVVISRTHPDFLIKLFQQEVPEIYEGIVEVKGAARESGERAKIAVCSHNSDVDPVGACVGIKGSRVQSVVQELKGEKIDIVHWSPDNAVFVKNTLSPAQISRVIVDDDAHAMEVVVPDDQLSLAIGKKGQNVRLAVKLTGWKIDIRSESADSEGRPRALTPDEALRREVEQHEAKQRAEAAAAASECVIAASEGALGVESIEGVGPKTAESLKEAGFTSVESIANASAEALAGVSGVGDKKAEKVIEAARALLAGK
jgi:N utilization substance protein A